MVPCGNSIGTIVLACETLHRQQTGATMPIYATLPRRNGDNWTVNLHHDEDGLHHITPVETTSLESALDIRSRFTNSDEVFK